MLTRRIALLISAMANDDGPAAAGDEVPRHDYRELAEVLPAEIVDYSRVAACRDPLVTTFSRRLGKATGQALWAYLHRADYALFFSDSERVGLPLAAMLKVAGASNRHIMVGHWLSPLKKAAPLKLGRLHTHIDCIACRIALQRDVAEGLGVPRAKLAVIPRGIDHHFWRPLPVEQGDAVFAAGLEGRDYQTLIEAVRQSGFETVITATSSWSHVKGLGRAGELPGNVQVASFDPRQLREQYARSRVVVVPLFDLDFQAGITVILEAMAMARPVVVSASRGQIGAGAVRHGDNGLYVPPGDARALRNAIAYLIEHPDEAGQMGMAGRELVENEYTLGRFVSRIKSLIEPLLATDVRAVAA